MVLLDQFPLWAVYIGTVLLILLAAESGYRIGIWIQYRNPGAEGAPVTNTVVGGMLALLAFLIALTIGIVVDQHNGRKSMVLSEANAVGTAYLRAGFLEEPDQSTARELLYEYVEVRLAAAADPARYEASKTRSEEIHRELWSIVEENVRQGNDSDIMGLFIESINEVIDVHTLRIAAAELRLPRLLGILLYAAMILSFILIGVANSADRKRDFVAMLLFAMAFVAVLMVIIDLDRPQQGLLNVSQQALSDLLQTMSAAG